MGNPACFIIAFSEPYSLDDNVAAIKELVSHPEWREATPIIEDFRKCDFSGITVDDIERVLVALNVMEASCGTLCHSIVVPKFGASKAYIYQFKVELKKNRRLNVFESHEFLKAVEWASSKSNF